MHEVHLEGGTRYARVVQRIAVGMRPELHFHVAGEVHFPAVQTQRFQTAVGRQEDAHIVPAAIQSAGKGRNHIRQATGFAEGSEFGGNVDDAHPPDCTNARLTLAVCFATLRSP